MEELRCVNCQTPQSQWTEHSGQGYPIDNQSYCSKDCSVGATETIQEHGSINQEKGKIRKSRNGKANLHYTASQAESGLWGRKEISEMNAAKVKRKDNSAQNRQAS